MSTNLQFDQIRLPPECETLRQDVRAFLADEIATGTFDPHRPGHGDSHDRHSANASALKAGSA